MTGTLIPMARRSRSRAPMEVIEHGMVTPETGLEGDCKGQRFPLRQITILDIADWNAAILELGHPDLPLDLPWTTRRANFLVENVRLPQGAGSLLTVGSVQMEVTGKTSPCAWMDHYHPGLRLALAPNWRGGVTCKVLQGGMVNIGADVTVTKELRQRPVGGQFEIQLFVR